MPTSRTSHCFLLIALSMALLLGLAAPNAFAGKNDVPDPETLPWALRDHFTLGVDDVEFIYGADNTEWSVQKKDVGLAIEKARTSVTLGDGTVLDVPKLKREEVTREEVKRSIGTGSRFGVLFEPENGLSVHHSVTVPDSYPFFIIEVTVKNGSEKPIDIAKISPVVLGPGSLRGPKGEIKGMVRRLGLRGNRPVFGPKVAPAIALFRDRAADLTLALWSLPGGVAQPRMTLEPFDGAWQGNVASVYNPPIRLKPGESMKADPVFISFAVPNPAETDTYQSWTHSSQPRREKAMAYPDCWVTLADDASASALVQAAQKWRGLGVRHALVPQGWEGRPGSLQGARPAFPKDMGRMASDLAAAEMTPGLTVDPLTAVEGKDAWSAVSDDGQRWLNLADPAAFAFAVDRMKQCVAWGYRFFVVQPSIIPDAVLRHFNMTRAQADTLAFRVMEEAAADLPVIPSTDTTLGADLADWLEAAGATSRLREFGLRSGPVRFDASNADTLDENVLAAMRFYGGPIEFVGSPKTRHASQWSATIPGLSSPGQPLDADQRAPLLWEVTDKGEDSVAQVVVAFPGAAAWTPADIPNGEAAEARILCEANGTCTEVPGNPPASNGALTVYGYCPKGSGPVVMGASASPRLAVQKAHSVKWDPASGILTGTFTANGYGGGTAYIIGPAHWTFRSGKASGASLKRSDSSVIPIQVAASGDTHFELKFKRE